MITIQPQYLSLSKLLDGRLFRIPEYQRAYSWTTHQRNDLFSDLTKAHEKGPSEGHFMAAIVCLRRAKQALGTDEYDILEVVDGQQRLTTLIILLNAIRFALKGKDKEAKLRKEIGELLVKVDGDELLLLQTNHDTSHYFANYLRSGRSEPSVTAKTIADRELLEAIAECTAFVSEWLEQGNTLPDLIALLKNRLFFLLHEIDDEKAVYTVFEVLNSRGLDVSWLDRLKSILMGAAFELKNVNQPGLVKDLHTIWKDVYCIIGMRQGMSTESLRFAATLRSRESLSRPLGEEDAVDCLRRLASKNAKSIREAANWMLRVTQACDCVMANPRLNAVTAISQARLLAVAIHLRQNISDKGRTDLLRRWEKVSFRIYGMLGNDKRHCVGDYVRLAWRTVNEDLREDRIAEGIAAIGEGFPIETAVEQLRNANLYEGWQDELRYFMFRYEEYLAAKKGLNYRNEQWVKIWLASAAESIEHILPQSKAKERHKHRLGNLVLLPPKLNASLQDDDPQDKVDSYRETGLLIASKVADLIDNWGWNVKAIDKREDELLEWAKKEWAD